MARPLRLSDIPKQVSAEDFWSLLGQLEHEQLEFKSSGGDLTPVIAAMSMTDGGLVAIGVDDNRKLIGCPLSQKTLDRVMKAAHVCNVDVQLEEIRVGRVPVTLVAVPEVRGRIVTTPDGRLLRRVGSDNQPLVGDSLGRFVRQREDRSAEDELIPTFDPMDFDLAIVNRALASEGRSTVRRDGLIRALVDLGVADQVPPPGNPTPCLAAAILFGNDPTHYVKGATVQLLRRVGVGPGPSPTSARLELRGPLDTVVNKSLDFVVKNTKRFEVITGRHREILPEYPEAVVREAMLNALAHRDYGLSGATVDVTIWDDRMEIRSPGPLPGHITVDNMRDEHYSRNRRLMRVLKLLGLVEEYGEGVDRMYREMEARLMEPPSFATTPASVTVTLRNRFLVSVEDQVWLALLAHFELSPSERRLLVLARHEEGVTPRRARNLMSSVDVEQLIAGAVAKGLLVRTGQRGGARYILSDEVVMRAGSTGLEAQARKRQMLLDEVRRRGSLSTPEGAELLGEDAALVRELLSDLVRAGLAVAEGRTRARRYYPR